MGTPVSSYALYFRIHIRWRKFFGWNNTNLVLKNKHKAQLTINIIINRARPEGEGWSQILA